MLLCSLLGGQTGGAAASRPPQRGWDQGGCQHPLPCRAALGTACESLPAKGRGSGQRRMPACPDPARALGRPSPASARRSNRQPLPRPCPGSGLGCAGGGTQGWTLRVAVRDSLNLQVVFPQVSLCGGGSPRRRGTRAEAFALADLSTAKGQEGLTHPSRLPAALAFEYHQRLCCNEPPRSLRCISCRKISGILPSLTVLNLRKTPGEDGMNPNRGSGEQRPEELSQPLQVSGWPHPSLQPAVPARTPQTPPPTPVVVTGTSPGPWGRRSGLLEHRRVPQLHWGG